MKAVQLLIMCSSGRMSLIHIPSLPYTMGILHRSRQVRNKNTDEASRGSICISEALTALVAFNRKRDRKSQLFLAGTGARHYFSVALRL